MWTTADAMMSTLPIEVSELRTALQQFLGIEVVMTD
jgi:hypothetical protein